MRISLAYWVLATGVCFGQTSFGDIENRISDFTLGNGMKFITYEKNLAPVVSFRTYADVGSAQDPPDGAGLAHMFEHMAFKGTSTLGTTNYGAEKMALEKVEAAAAALREGRRMGNADKAQLSRLEAALQSAQDEAEKYVVPLAYAAAIEGAGGRGLNATTSQDGTSFYYNLPSNATELWFFLESHRFSDPVFRQFYKERSVVMQERRLRVEDNALGKLFETFLATAFQIHPYGRPVLGKISELDNLTRSGAEAFFHKYYQASNLTAAIVGNVNAQTVKRLAQEYFGPLPASPKPTPLTLEEPRQTSERSVTVHLAAQRIVCMGYHRPELNHPDSAAYEVLNGLLIQGRSARFNRELLDRGVITRLQGLVTYPSGKYPNLMVFCMNPAPGRSNDEAVDAAAAIFERIKADGVTDEEVSGAKARFRAAFLYQLKDNPAIASQLAQWQAMTGSWRNLFRYLERVAAVKPEDVRMVARKTLNRDNMTVAKIEPIVTGATQ